MGASNAPVILEKYQSVLVVFAYKVFSVLQHLLMILNYLSVGNVEFEFVKVKGNKINLHTNSPTFRAAKLMGFTVSEPATSAVFCKCVEHNAIHVVFGTDMICNLLTTHHVMKGNTNVIILFNIYTVCDRQIA